MNHKKICFICCVNDEQYEEECRSYLMHMEVPQGMQMEIQFVKGAESMAAGYNMAMHQSDAKYKVYLHQDMFIINKYFVQDMLNVFEDERVGMMGVVGGQQLPQNGIIYSAWNCGRLSTNDSFASFEINGKIKCSKEGLVVEAVDGCLIATQYDLPWREDLFDGWDFYDVSQSLEFRKAGYLVKVPNQKRSWCLHDDGYQNLKNYDSYRKILLGEYGEFLQGNNIEERVDFNLDLWNTTDELKKSLIELFDKQEYEAVYAFLAENYVKLARETELSVLRNVMEIWYEERMMQVETGFLEAGIPWEDVYRKYQQLKFWLYQMEYRLGVGENCIVDEIERGSISAPALVKMLSHNTIKIRDMLFRLANIYRHVGKGQIANQYAQMASGMEMQGGAEKGKIAFIVCTNNEQYKRECEAYIKDLEVPTGYEAEFLPICGARSMTSGYNIGMKQSDAKYKVYLHQDVFIWNRHFLYDMLEVFEGDESIGMLGVLGGTNIPDNGVLYTSWNEGITYACDTQDAGVKQGRNPMPGTYQEVEALDGMLLATQYDLPWREDLFDGWDFYDISQSFEFRKNGYTVVVPHQQEPWCMHDCGRTKLQNYNTGRKILLQEYAKFFKNPTYTEEDFSYNDNVKQSYDALKAEIINAMADGELEQAKMLSARYDDAEILDTDLSLLKKVISVCEIEQQLYGSIQTWQIGLTYGEVLEKYHGAKFLLWRMEREVPGGKEQLIERCVQERYTLPLLIQAGIHNAYRFLELLPLFMQICVEKKSVTDLNYLEFITKQISGAESMDFAQARIDIQADAQEEQKFNSFKTETDIAKVEKLCDEMAEIRKKYLPEYQEKINALLASEDRVGLSEVLSDAEFVEKFETHTDMAYMMLSHQIYLEEVQDNVQKTIFDGHYSIEEVVAYIQEIKFRLWHLEFETESDAAKEMIDFIQKNQISGCLLKYMVHVAGMDKVGLLERLAVVFLDCHMLGFAFSMLKYAEELAPGAEDILCTMADLCLQAGKKEEALACLDKVVNPSQTTAAFRRLCES